MSKALEEVELPYESTFSAPSGPVKEFPYIGEQGTFTQRRDDLLPSNGKNMPHLMHHVPLNKRGPYKLLVGENLLGERIHQSGYAMCNGIVGATNNRGERSQANPTGEPRPCKAKAINRSGYCSRHGGMLHPLDRKRIDWDAAPREIKWKFGKLPVDELDDEELSRGQIRKADGTWTDNNFVSAEVHDAMVKKLFERADTKLRENLLVAVDTMAEIAKGTAYEPADRIKAAQWMYERVRGKVPTEVVVSQDKPFEVVLADVMLGGSRAESRARRGIDEGTIDAEFVEELSEDLDLGQSVDAEAEAPGRVLQGAAAQARGELDEGRVAREREHLPQGRRSERFGFEVAEAPAARGRLHRAVHPRVGLQAARDQRFGGHDLERGAGGIAPCQGPVQGFAEGTAGHGQHFARRRVHRDERRGLRDVQERGLRRCLHLPSQRGAHGRSRCSVEAVQQHALSRAVHQPHLA